MYEHAALAGVNVTAHINSRYEYAALAGVGAGLPNAEEYRVVVKWVRERMSIHPKSKKRVRSHV